MRSRLLITLTLALLTAFLLQVILQAWPVARHLPTGIAVYLIPLAAVAATVAIFTIAPKRMLDVAAPVADAHPEPTPVGEVVGGSEKNLTLLPDTHADMPLTPVPTHLALADGSVRDARLATHILRRGNARYRLSAVTDAKMLFKTFNATGKSAARFYGHPAETLRGLDIGELNMAPASTIRVRPQEAANSEGVPFETHHRLASGETRDVEVSIPARSYWTSACGIRRGARRSASRRSPRRRWTPSAMRSSDATAPDARNS